MEEVLIDTGFENQRAQELFAPGDVVTLDGPMEPLGKGLLRSRGMDDRIGCVAVLLAAQQLHEAPPPCTVTVVLASGEEIGMAGASTASFAVMPTTAVAVDVSFGDGFGVPQWKCGKLGKGPMIGIAPVLNKNLSDQMQAVAKAQNIPFQLEVMGGRTGTDADSIAATAGGIPTALLSIPLRNMHTAVETVCVEDVEHTAQLLVAFAKEVAR